MSSSSGCDCGGSSAAGAVTGTRGCGCGSDAPTSGGGFVRPHFFGGMLLTEDDLQSTVDYAAAKRKLTNRHVIGAGVVCGLEVTCSPCDTGKVEVSPGYAIEGCGNDIVVSCPEQVDILALVRDLRLKRGIDCGEPCDTMPGQDYRLYIRYTETPTEPVAPYASDDCATGECEFSRIREGYAFEVRCEAPADPRTLIDALVACQPHGEGLADDTRAMARVLEIVAPPRPPASTGSSAQPAGQTTDVRSAPAPDAVATDRTSATGGSTGSGSTTGPEETTGSDVVAEFVRGAEVVRTRILGDLARRGLGTCDDYRTVSHLSFDGLNDASRHAAISLGQAYLRSAAACSCAALHPPCPTWTDDAVALARVRVVGCDVTEVCSLERRWVLAPRSLDYWFPVVSMLRDAVEPGCCEPLVLESSRYVRPVDRLGIAVAHAVAAFRDATSAPLEVRQGLLAATGGSDSTAASTETSSAGAAEPGAQTAPTAQAVALDAAALSLSALEVKLEELSARIDQLTAAEARPGGAV
jgi:hypothetical protein